MEFGTFLVVSLHGDLKQLYVMIQILRGVEILQVVYLYISYTDALVQSCIFNKKCSFRLFLVIPSKTKLNQISTREKIMNLKQPLLCN